MIAATESILPEVLLLDLKKFFDPRGYFLESFRTETFQKLIGPHLNFVQDNESFSKEANTLRGLHFQRTPHGQSKLVRVVQGKIFDIALDLRKNSPSYGRWQSFVLTDDKVQSLFIPEGFAHGFVTMIKNTLVQYKCTNYYAPQAEGGINWNDPALGIPWPLSGPPLLSERDQSWPNLIHCEPL